MANKALKFKRDQIAVLIVAANTCGCTTVPVGTIVKVAKAEPDDDNEVAVNTCPDSCDAYVNVNNLRKLIPGKESLQARALFEAGNEYKPANINQVK